MSAHDYMRARDVGVFSAAAVRFKAWILVRRSNVAAKDYIGKAGYVPKRLDCKAKSADKPATLPLLGRKETAGLVVNPKLPGMGTAFKSTNKFNDAVRIWDKYFAMLCWIPRPGDAAKAIDIQHWLNRNMGVAMILHGDQEKYSDDVEVDVFWPDRRPPTEAYGAGAIRRLYETTFQGRHMFGPGAQPQPYFGKWEKV